MKNVVWTRGTSGLEGEFQSASEVDFYVDKVHFLSIISLKLKPPERLSTGNPSVLCSAVYVVVLRCMLPSRGTVHQPVGNRLHSQPVVWERVQLNF